MLPGKSRGMYPLTGVVVEPCREMTMKLRWVFATSVFVLAACATNQAKQPEPEWEHERREIMRGPDRPTERSTGYPKLSEEATTEVGRNMLYVSKITAIQQLQVANSFAAYIKHGGEVIELLVSAGTMCLIGYGKDGERFYTNGKIRCSYEQRTKGLFKFDHMANGGVMVDASGRTFVHWMWDGYPQFITPAPAAPTKEVDEIETPGGGSVRSELVYAGLSGDTVSILYREFVNDMARPAFSQDLRYDLSKSRQIGYRGARIEVLQADNVGISYRVLSHLDARAK